MCHTDQTFYFFTVFFSHNTRHLHFKAFMVDIKDKVTKTFLLKTMHFLLLSITCLKIYLLFKGSVFQLDMKKYFLHLEAALNQFSLFFKVAGTSLEL